MGALMRISSKAGRFRILIPAACVLLLGSAIAAASTPARAAVTAPLRAAAPGNTIAVTNPGNQVTNPLSTVVGLTLTATDSDPTQTLTFSATGLPTGLKIDATTGTIAGTITVPGTYAVTVTATDTTAATGSAAFTWTAANTVTITPPGNQVTDPLSTAVDLAIVAADTDPTQTLAYTATGLPPGLHIAAATGAITGTITTPGAYPVTVTATDKATEAATVDFTWTARNTITITPVAAQASGIPAVVDLPIVAADDDAAATLAYAATGLPAGLRIGAATGIIAGTTTTPGDYAVVVTVTDSLGEVATLDIAWTVANTVAVAAPGAEQSLFGTKVSVQVTATDSTPTEALTYTAAGLPAGLKINAVTGLISGTITGVAGTYDVTVTARDATGAAGDAVIAWRVLNLVTVTAPGAKQSYEFVRASIQIVVTDSDPTQALTFSATGLPPGVSINAVSGVISGTPSGVGKFAVVVKATDGSGSAGTARITWTVSDPIIIPNPGAVGVPDGQTLNLPFTFSDALRGERVKFAASGLPRGLSFEPNPPTIYGWAIGTGRYRVTITGTGSHGDRDSMTFPLVVRSAADAGPTGPITLNAAGKCLDDRGNRTANGTPAVLANCLPGSAQLWTLAVDGTIRVHDRCLDIAGGGSAGEPAQLWQCTGSSREMWVQATAGELFNPGSGLCLTAASTRNGAAPVLGTCRVKPSQAWTVPAQMILSSMAGKCVDDYHSVGNNGNKVDVYSCNGTPVQHWAFEPDGTLRIYGNKCLTDTVWGRVGVRIDLWTCNGNRTQRWTVVQSGSLGIELMQDGVCLAVPSMTAIDGSQLVAAACNAADPRIHWHTW